jgi:hypothetical protein
VMTLSRPFQTGTTGSTDNITSVDVKRTPQT